MSSADRRTPAASNVISASGGLVFRRAGDTFEVLAVHRPRYDDWSLPKGKDDPGETAEQAAVREVEEETGRRAHIVAPLTEVEYQTPSGARKRVRYFAMRPLAAATPFSPNEEVDEIRWVTPGEAQQLLTYRRDRDLVATTDLDSLAATGKLFLVRHAAAGDRSHWADDDARRPLTRKGERQVAALTERLLGAGIDRVLTSPYERCRATVEPLAAKLGVDVEVVPALGEGSALGESLDIVDSLTGTNAVISSHGDVIPALLEALRGRGLPLPAEIECKKGSVWAVDVRGGACVQADYQPPPRV